MSEMISNLIARAENSTLLVFVKELGIGPVFPIHPFHLREKTFEAAMTYRRELTRRKREVSEMSRQGADL